MAATEVDYETDEKYFKLANKNVKLAIVMILTHSNREEAQEKLDQEQGFVGKTIKNKC